MAASDARPGVDTDMPELMRRKEDIEAEILPEAVLAEHVPGRPHIEGRSPVE